MSSHAHLSQAALAAGQPRTDNPVGQSIFEWIRDNTNAIPSGYLGNKMWLPKAEELLTNGQFKSLRRHLKKQALGQTKKQLRRASRDAGVSRKAMELAIRQQLEREQKARTSIVSYQHNNEQIAFQRRAKKNGLPVVTEKNYVDLGLKGFVGEVKINPSKGDFEHAYGHLDLAAELNDAVGKFILAVGKNFPKTILEWLTSRGIHAISRIKGKYRLENSLPGNALLKRAIA